MCHTSGNNKSNQIEGKLSWKRKCKCLALRPCQIYFLFRVTRADAEKSGSLNFFIEKFARRSFLFLIGERTLVIYFNFKNQLKDIKEHVLNK